MTRSLRTTARDSAPWIERLARLGYASQGTLYGVIGFLAAMAAVRRRGAVPDRGDAIAFIQREPFGNAILIAIAAGLAGYAVWRLLCGLFDSEREGSGPRGLLIRLGSLARGLGYLATSFGVVALVIGIARKQVGSDTEARKWTAMAMAHPFGRLAVLLAGFAMLGAAIYQIYTSFKKRLSRHLPQALINETVIRISRAGIAIRGVLFAIIGLSLVSASSHHNAARASGSAGALRTIALQPFGRVLLLITGAGLLAYGVYGFVNARYRKIRVV